jgi:hypothetical protein
MGLDGADGGFEINGYAGFIDCLGSNDFVIFDVIF